MKNFTGSIWSGEEEENPGLHTSYKVYVPYCTSDIYAGRRDPDEVSAGFAFHGKFVVEAIVEDLLNNVLFEVDISQFVLMGMSAGRINKKIFHTKDPSRSFWSWKQLRLSGKPSEGESGRDGRPMHHGRTRLLPDRPERGRL